MGEADEFGHFPDIDSSIPPSDLDQWSLAPTAADQVREDLITQTQLRQIAEKKARQIQARCKALEAKLNASQTARKRGPGNTATELAENYEQPRKRSPANPMIDLISSHDDRRIDQPSSGEDPPSSPEETGSKLPTFEGLNSIVCACGRRDSERIEPTYDGEINFMICTEMCNEEIEELDKWTPEQKAQRRPMILSALRMLYPRKPDRWFSKKSFLKSPRGTAQYWRKVLVQRSRHWLKRHQHEEKKAKAMGGALAAAALTPIQRRIREKLQRAKPKSAATLSPRGRKATPIIIGTDSSHSEDSDEPKEVQSALELSQPESKNTPEQKLAPGPETYSRSEMKTFAKIATAINEVDVTKGHSAAVADFIDSEFSDNSGMMSKARRAPKDSWRRKRFNSACEKAAKIMEER